MTDQPNTAANIRAEMLEKIPSNSSPLRQLRRWNVEHGFIVSWLFWSSIAALIALWMWM